MKVLKQKNILEKFITNAEAHLEPCQISKMELFGITIFAKNHHHRFLTGFQIRLSNGRRYLKVKELFRKFGKYLRKKLSWSTVLVKLQA